MGMPFLQGGVLVLFCRAKHFPSIPDVPGTKTKPSTANAMKRLRSRHSSAGVKRRFLDKVVLPSWWADSIAATPCGLREAAGDICAHLGYSLGSLLDENQPLTFAHTGAVKYKKTKGVTDEAVALATHHALGVVRAAASAMTDLPAVAAVPRPGSHGFVDKCEDNATVRIACQASSSPQTARAFFWRTRRAAASARAFSLRRSSDSR
jgi:hypothetical protein